MLPLVLVLVLLLVPVPASQLWITHPPTLPLQIGCMANDPVGSATFWKFASHWSPISAPFDATQPLPTCRSVID
jgi:hypothetical protein